MAENNGHPQRSAQHCLWEKEGVKLCLHVQPGAAQSEWVGPETRGFKVRIASRPIEGQANKTLIQFLAELFKVPQAQVTMVRGNKGREKWVRIDSPRRLPAGICPNPSDLL